MKCEEKVMLKDIAGYDEQKEEAKKIINILSNYSQFAEMGAYIPRGLILSGEPGVGKTMFAKAIANESGVPLFEFENNEDEDEDGAVRGLRAVFAEARKCVPSIVFIDELDELISSRSFFSDTSRKTLKVLLTEIDGIKNSNGIMVIATTNHRNDMPDSIIRSGRMDKKIVMPMPDAYSRTKIAELYLRKNPIFKDIDENLLSTKLIGFNCADIKTLINETLLDCLSSGKKDITMDDFERIIPVIRFKDIKKTVQKTPDYVIYHEAGHAVANIALFNAYGAVSVEQYGNIRGVATVEYDSDKEEEQQGASDLVSNIRKRMVVALSGHAGEVLSLNGDCSIGSESDIGKARSLARTVLNSGAMGFGNFVSMSERHEIMSISEKEDYDRAYKNQVQAINNLLDESKEEAIRTIELNIELYNAICKSLKEKKRLTKAELEALAEKCGYLKKPHISLQDGKETGMISYSYEKLR